MDEHARAAEIEADILAECSDAGSALSRACRIIAILDAANERLVADLRVKTSHGYRRAGNAYARPSVPKPRVEPIDISKEQAPHD